MKLRSTLAIFASTLIFSATVAAQGNYADGVTIYEHCNFKGKSQTLTSGDYSSMRNVGFGNDSVSSIKIPRGSQAVIYEDDNYRGSYASVDQDIHCFDKHWNDKVSSMTVREAANHSRSNDRYNERNSNRRDNNSRRDNSSRRGDNTQRYQANVTAQNVAHVVFDGSSLQKVAPRQWILDNPRERPTQLQEVRRDRDSVFLESKFTAERITINLFANDVTVTSRDGRQQRYGIDSKNTESGSSNTARPNNPVVSSPNAPNRRIPTECFNFKAYTHGGNASVRFHGKKGLHRFNTKASSGRICHNGSLTMEIGKTEPGTDVSVEISGNRYRFTAGEKEDKFLNNWYRKSVTLLVGR